MNIIMNQTMSPTEIAAVRSSLNHNSEIPPTWEDALLSLSLDVWFICSTVERWLGILSSKSWSQQMLSGLLLVVLPVRGVRVLQCLDCNLQQDGFDGLLGTIKTRRCMSLLQWECQQSGVFSIWSCSLQISGDMQFEKAWLTMLLYTQEYGPHLSLQVQQVYYSWTQCPQNIKGQSKSLTVRPHSAASISIKFIAQVAYMSANISSRFRASRPSFIATVRQSGKHSIHMQWIGYSSRLVCVCVCIKINFVYSHKSTAYLVHTMKPGVRGAWLVR